jgi:iron transport multicopper oxidase
MRSVGVILSVMLWVGCGNQPPGGDAGRFRIGGRTAADGVSVAGDELRTGWYPNQPLLAPARVSAPDFGQLFDTPISGEVHAQPLLAGGRLLVVTETNDVYSLDPVSGAVLAHRTLHVPWTPSNQNDPGLNCIPLQPNVGIMGTPVVDTGSNTAYFFAKTYASGSSGPAAYWAHAVDVASLDERPGFPVLIQGNADNQPGLTFDPKYHLQRPGLLLMNGVVYAGFAGICDAPPWQGWLFGVSTAGQIAARWSAEPALSNGAGIWMTGGAPMVDGLGTFVVSTGNGPVPAQPTPGTQTPGGLGQAWIRLVVQGDGTLKATDFFMPYDAPQLNDWDGDLGSGAPMGLPDAFGTAALPHLSVVTGKQGYVYLINRDSLGGYQQGPAGGDAVLQRLGPYGGVWGKPAAWPGSGGWVYIPTVSAGSTPGGSSGTFDVYRASVDGNGLPSLARVAQADGAFGLGTSAAVVTSEGTNPGTALVWLQWSANNTGFGAELRAYDAVPVAGKLVQRYRATIGKATRYAPPGVGDGRIYVATGDGHVKAFGSPVDPVITAPPVDFGPVPLGSSAGEPVVFTAQRQVNVTAVSGQGDFSVQGTQPPLPVSLAAGQTVTVQARFTPSFAGVDAAALVVTTDQGPFSTSLSGIGMSTTGNVQPAPVSLSFGGVAIGRTTSSAVTFTNVGGAPASILSVQTPEAPFSVTGLPAPSTILAPQQAVTTTIQFAPTQAGQFDDQLVLVTDQGAVEVPMSGVSASEGQLQLSTTTLDFGQVRVGDTARQSFTISNGGGTRLRVNKSQPPGLEIGFRAVNQLPEGTTLDPGADMTLEVSFTPLKLGSAQDRWLITADDDQGAQQVVVTGTGGQSLTGDGTSSGCSATGATPGVPLALLSWLLVWRRRRPG